MMWSTALEITLRMSVAFSVGHPKTALLLVFIVIEDTVYDGFYDHSSTPSSRYLWQLLFNCIQYSALREIVVVQTAVTIPNHHGDTVSIIIAATRQGPPQQMVSDNSAKREE